MIEVGKTLISDDIKEKMFVCDIDKCKGACCVEGDLGAPVEEDEIEILEEIYEKVKPYLSAQGIAEIEKQGVVVNDWQGEFSTPIINGKECVYVTYEADGTLKCGIEKAYEAGEISYKKPISCHLYPVRLMQLKNIIAVNYDMWSICSDACVLGEELKVPLYKFLKEPLIRKFGEDWYKELVKKIDKSIS